MSPDYYKAGKVQVWDVTRHMTGNMAQAFGYVARFGRKSQGEEALQDLQKAIDFLENWAEMPILNRCPENGSIADRLKQILQTMESWQVHILMAIYEADKCGSRFLGHIAIESLKKALAEKRQLIQERLI